MRFLIFLLIIFFYACSGVQKAKKLEIAKNTQFLNWGKSDSIRISYTGCGGFLIQNHQSAIMLDPYFSNLSPLWIVPFKKLKPDTTEIDEFFKSTFDQKRDKAGKLKAIIIAHSHYDHLADVPTIYKRNSNADSTLIIGSATTQHILKGASVEWDSIINLNKKLGLKRDNFIYTRNRRIRILPIPSEHAPHIFGIKLISSKKVKEDYKQFPVKARKFPEGENYNFLIDFLDEKGQPSFRVFSHAGAAADSLLGVPTSKVLKEKKVDILLLCVASYNQVKGYPKALLDSIQPRLVVLNHWENFFKPITKLKKKPACVPGTNVKKFLSYLPDSLHYILPEPLTEIVIGY